MKVLSILILCISFLSTAQAQEKPKLVVGIIVDQMRQEYLYRFEDRYGNGGFKRLIGEGYMFKNAHFNYVPTYTGPGHTSVYTGTTPSIHGIIANNWYDKKAKESIYCAFDATKNTVGSDSDKGKMSPHNLFSTTITDELRLSNQMRSKVVGLSIKDRGAIFPAGHTGSAYWYDNTNGKFITSDYYSEQLPDWMTKFNNRKLADKFLKQTWNTLEDISTYVASGEDMNAYEGKVNKKDPVFPYDLSKPKNTYWALPATPFGNDILLEASLAALDGEGLGADDITDFLAISFSSTDYVGHNFGPNSVEVEDTYMRLDKNIERLLKELDDKVGKGNYIVFLTADHAVADIPQFLVDKKIPVGNPKWEMKKELGMALSRKYGEGEWVESVSNQQVFLNRQLIVDKNLSLYEVQNQVSELMLIFEGVAESYAAHAINQLDYEAGGLKGMLIRGYNQVRSGDVLYSLRPGWLQGGRVTGTTHGSGFTYDTHVPMLWYGAGIPKGTSVKYHPITDIAPTISMMLEIKLPNGATGQPLVELFK